VIFTLFQFYHPFLFLHHAESGDNVTQTSLPRK
jgi:hypothetical protein